MTFELFLFCMHKKIFKNKIRIMVFLILFVGIFLSSKNILGDVFINYISELFPNSFTGRRMVQFGQFLKSEGNDLNGATYRFKLYWISINTFFQNLFIGISYLTHFIKEKELFHLGVKHLGLHSSIFDGLARMGCFFMIYIIYYVKLLKYLKNKTNSNAVIIVGIILFMIKVLNIGDVFIFNCITYFSVPLLCKVKQRVVI